MIVLMHGEVYTCGTNKAIYEFFRQAEANSGPVMLTFKQFLNTQSDDIEDMEAVRKYQEYKLEFRKTQIADFFTSHKDEEWYVHIRNMF